MLTSPPNWPHAAERPLRALTELAKAALDYQQGENEYGLIGRVLLGRRSVAS
jgi:hypothetical protein